MSSATYTLPDEYPDVVFTVDTGSGGDSELPSNWIRVTGTVTGTPVEDDNGTITHVTTTGGAVYRIIDTPADGVYVISRAGFAGP